MWGDSRQWLCALPEESVDLFFTSPPYADMRSYARIHPDDYVEWFCPFAEAMLRATCETGSFVLNIKDRVVRGERHPYVLRLILALRELGWRWVETYIWAKPNAIPGRFGPRTKDAWEYVIHFAKGPRPYFDLDAVRVPYRTSDTEITRRVADRSPRRTTTAGHGRTRAATYGHGRRRPGQRDHGHPLVEPAQGRGAPRRDARGSRAVLRVGVQPRGRCGDRSVRRKWDHRLGRPRTRALGSGHRAASGVRRRGPRPARGHLTARLMPCGAPRARCSLTPTRGPSGCPVRPRRVSGRPRRPCAWEGGACTQG